MQAYTLTCPSSHIKFTPNSRFILASTQDSTIRLWNTQTSKCVKTYAGHTNRTFCIFADFAPGRKHIVSGSEDMKVYFWDLQTREIVQVLDGHRGASAFRGSVCSSLIWLQMSSLPLL